ncbi:MAG: metallopeptidase TldD-related protein [Candidatus Nanopelagicales bacterium]
MRAQEIAEAGLELLGGDRGAILVAETGVANLRWANSTLTTNGMSQARSVTVLAHPSVAGGLGSGTASGPVSGRVDLQELVDRARAAALGAGADDDAVDDPPAGVPSPDWDADPAVTSPDALTPVSALLGAVLPDREVEHFGYAEHTMSSTYLASTGGLRRRHDQPAARFELCGKSHGRTRSAWAGRAGRHFIDLDLASAPGEVRTGLDAQATRIDIDPGRHRVLLSPSAAADLLIYLLWSAGARDALDGRSAFGAGAGQTLVGRSLTEQLFWLRSDPSAPGLECAEHVQSTSSSAISSAFDLGLQVGATDWIEHGTLRSLLTTRHTAARSGLPLTPYVDNLLAGVEGQSGSLDQVATRMGDGLLVTCLWYIREVDAQRLLLTGLTRDGVYVVRDGEVVGAAGNFRFNDSPLGMLGRIGAAGDPVDCLPREWADWFTRTRVAPLVIDGFHLSTASEAI